MSLKINRFQYLVYCTLCCLNFLFGCSSQPSAEEREVQTQVLVIGGGSGGTTAAIQAARSGAQVILVEETSWLGGMLTAAGVSATDGNHQLPSGLWGAFRQHIYEHYGGPDSVATGWVSNTHFEPKIGNEVWHKMVRKEPNLLLLPEHRLVNMIKVSSKVVGAQFVNQKGDFLTIKAAITIDATELGDALALAEASFYEGQDPASLTGEEAASENPTPFIQDLTFAAILKDFGPGSDKTLTKPDHFDPQEFNCACKELCDDPTFEVVDCETMMEYARLPNDKFLINWPINGNDYYVNSLGMNNEERMQVYQKAKQKTLAFIYYLQTVGGFKNLGLAEDEFPTTDQLPLIPYHRESRRVKGISFLTVNDLINPYSSNLYQTAIAVGDYPLDHHHKEALEASLETFPAIPSFSVPYGCLVPEQVDGLLVAEKSISVSHLTNGATRLQPCVILIGQAAGAAAALCALQGEQPRNLDVRELQQHLLDSDCWLMPFLDVNPNDKTYFQAVQRVGLSGVMRGTGVPHQWANQTWFYPDSLVTKSSFQEIYLAASGAKIELEISDGFPTRSQVISYFEQSHWPQTRTKNSAGWNDQKLTRKELAYLIDAAFDPFNSKPLAKEAMTNRQ